MTLEPGDTVKVHLVRCNGALEKIFTDLPQAEAYMRATRRNGQFWTIRPMKTEPHQTAAVAA